MCFQKKTINGFLLLFLWLNGQMFHFLFMVSYCFLMVFNGFLRTSACRWLQIAPSTPLCCSWVLVLPRFFAWGPRIPCRRQKSRVFFASFLRFVKLRVAIEAMAIEIVDLPIFLMVDSWIFPVREVLNYQKTYLSVIAYEVFSWYVFPKFCLNIPHDLIIWKSNVSFAH